MKKTKIILTALAIATLLTACANTSEEISNTISNPFEESVSKTDTDSSDQPQYDNLLDDYDNLCEEYYHKYQRSTIYYDYKGTEENSTFEFNGDDIEIKFVANTIPHQDYPEKANKYTMEVAYSVYIDGVMQKISLDGNEYSETVPVSIPPYKQTEVSIKVKPELPEDCLNKEKHTLKLVCTLHTNFVMHEKLRHLHFVNINDAYTLVYRYVVFNEQPTIIQPFTAYENVTQFSAKDKTLNYGLKCPGLNENHYLRIFPQSDNSYYLTLDDNKLNGDMIFDGAESGKYRVYFFVNNKRVNVNDAYYASVEVKEGFVPKIPFTLDNLQNYDTIYAIAVNEDEGATRNPMLLKSETKLVFPPDDPVITGEGIPKKR